MYRKALLLISLVLFMGCSQIKNKNGEKSDFEQLFTRDEVYHKSLVNTQKAQLMASFETKALLTATYLNPVFPDKLYDGEYFFVGIYLSNSETHEFNTRGYSLSLNGLQPIEVKKLEKTDPLRYEMPMVDNWSTYYKVKYPKVTSNKFQLIFESDRFGKDVLNYSKREKSLFLPLEDSGK